MKTILLTLTYLVGLGELALAVFFWVTHSKSEVRKVMALLAFSTGMWVILSAFTAYKPDIGNVHIASNFVFVFGIVLVSVLLHLVVIFPYPMYKFDKLHTLLFYLPALTFSIIAVGTQGLQIGSTGDSNTAGAVIPGPVYSVYNLYIFLYYITTIIILLFRLKHFEGTHKFFAKAMLAAAVLGGAPAIFVDVIVPTILPNLAVNFLYGVLSSGFWLGAIVYLINRRG